MKKILIVYYSYSGNTRKLAQMIKERTGGDLWEIKLVDPYPETYEEISERAKREQKEENYPLLLGEAPDLENYDTVIIGTPNWWGSLAWPVYSFLQKYDLFGKTVLLFSTHGGSGVGNLKKELAKYCPQTERAPLFSVYGADVEKNTDSLDQWLEMINKRYGG